MSYQYPATPEERVAAALLREKGWGVSEPACPDCRGFGVIGFGESWGDEQIGGGSWSAKACPRGCAMRSMFFSTAATNAIASAVNAIAGPVVGNRGVR